VTDFNRDDVHERCQAGVACHEVTDRLHAVERARELGLAPDDPAVAGLRRKAEQIADAHQRGSAS
jgi:hypothetical protein